MTARFSKWGPPGPARPSADARALQAAREFNLVGWHKGTDGPCTPRSATEKQDRRKGKGNAARILSEIVGNAHETTEVHRGVGIGGVQNAVRIKVADTIRLDVSTRRTSGRGRGHGEKVRT